MCIQTWRLLLRSQAFSNHVSTNRTIQATILTTHHSNSNPFSCIASQKVHQKQSLYDHCSLVSTPAFVACSTNAGVRRPGYKTRVYVVWLYVPVNNLGEGVGWVSWVWYYAYKHLVVSLLYIIMLLLALWNMYHVRSHCVTVVLVM